MGEVRVQDDSDKGVLIRVDQEHLETVVPKVSLRDRCKLCVLLVRRGPNCFVHS